MRRELAFAILGTLTALAGAAPARSQPGASPPVTPAITSVAAIHADPQAFHEESVRIVGTVTRQGERVLLSEQGVSVQLLSPESIPIGDVEVRGVVLDVGRLSREDARLGPLRGARPPGAAGRPRWPAPGEDIAIAVKSFAPQSREIAGIAVARQPALPLDVDFSVPIEGEADVSLDTRIRLQFSRDVDAASLEHRVRLRYSGTDSVERGEAQPPEIGFTIAYDPGTRTLELQPARLERFRPVIVELLEGIVGADGSVLRPWRLHFTTGGS